MSILCIVPPHLLRSIERNGSQDEREWALDTLRLDEATRFTRHRGPVGPVVAHSAESTTPAPPAPVSTASRSIYDAQHATKLPGVLARQEGAAEVADVAVNEAYEGLGATLRLYGDAFHRDSLDGRGQNLVATVHYGNRYNNAQWNGSQMVFGDGDGTIFNRFTIAIDIVGHELTHGVTQHTAGLTYFGQSGALNESVSDVFGSLVKQYHAAPQQTAADADWLIGQGIFAPGVHGSAIRSMKAPGTAYDDPKLGKDPQPATMADYQDTFQDNGGVHINSGIPNHAFYVAAVALGGYAWERAGQVWYDTLVDATLPHSATFVQFAAMTIAKAARFGSQAQDAVHDAWRQVGIEPGKLLAELI